MLSIVMLIIVWLGLNNDQATFLMSENNYRAAKYSIKIDNTGIQHIVPGLPSSTISYRYYLQYGKNIIIQLTDLQSEDLTTMTVKWDYPNRKSTSELLLNHVNKYYTNIDSIPFSIEESRGIVKNLSASNARCDSLLFSSRNSNSEFLLYFNDSIPNLTSHELFYPDVDLLPYKIIKKGPRNTTRILEEVFYGKHAVDSLLNLFGHEGYDLISDEEMNLYKLQYPIEPIENLLPKKN